MHTDSLRSVNSNNIIKYADDTVIMGKLSALPDSVQFQNSVNDVCAWSNENGLLLEKTKCIECVFLRNLHPEPWYTPFHIDEVPIKNEDRVKYLGVIFSSTCSWTSHIHEKFSKLLKLSFMIGRLISLRTPHAIITRFVDACALPVLLYCSPVILPGLLLKDQAILRRSVKVIANSSGIPVESLVEKIADRHIRASHDFAQQILADQGHPLHQALAESRSRRSSRCSFNPIFARSNSYRNSIVPFLARVLSNKEQELEKFRSSILR